ncbi:amino acid-binding protein [Thermodesulfomicrobium sp. WS]|jgi:glycine cleavage system transcriptional repressor|uniref:glycine cleavage system protein R n=1 Tax=Thermodesulfomicrobium sp. WS TaxID=3004129 RepID=UPI00248FC897|nr:ACT domain-containing protein [Thermodesulfomicrobium sp. WS]BDV01991.1 amino acid-binding protein [Thermodesulfomicrobium sp. WS]
MEKFAVSVMGHDRPGILAAVSETVFGLGCNIEDVSQTILQGEFAAIMIVARPPHVPLAQVDAALRERLAPMGLGVFVRPLDEGWQPAVPGEPFVLTTRGKDQPGNIAAVTRALAQLGCNVTQFRAVLLPAAEEGEEMVMILEIDVPQGVHHRVVRAAVAQACQPLGMEVSLQHRDVFENIHRV